MQGHHYMKSISKIIQFSHFCLVSLLLNWAQELTQSVSAGFPICRFVSTDSQMIWSHDPMDAFLDFFALQYRSLAQTGQEWVVSFLNPMRRMNESRHYRQVIHSKRFRSTKGFSAWNTGSVGKPSAQHACRISSCGPEVFWHLVMLCWQSLSRTVPVQTARRYWTVPWHQEVNEFACGRVWKDVMPCSWCIFQISYIRPFLDSSGTVPALAWWQVASQSIWPFTTDHSFESVEVRCLLKVLRPRKFRNLVIEHDSLSNAIQCYRKSGHMDLTLAPLWKYSGISDEDGDIDRCPQEEALDMVLSRLGVEELVDVRNMKGVTWTLGIERLLCPRSTIPIEFNTRKTAWNRPKDSESDNQ